MKQLKVLFIPTMNAGVAYYRMYQFKDAINRLGLASVVMPFYDPEAENQGEWQWYADKDFTLNGSRGELVHLISQADVIVTQYVHTPQALALLEGLKATFQHPDIIKQHGKKVFLAEIDDDVLDTPPWNAAFQQYGPNQKIRNTVIEFLKAMDGVICSTPFLAAKYADLNENTYVVPNGIDLRQWDKYKNEHAKNEIRIGWSGGASHDEDLRTIEAPIKEILAANKNVSFHIFHGCPDFFKDQSKIIWHRDYAWIDKYPRALKRLKFDIGIAPLVDCDFNRGKSNLRKLEYGAMAVPVVAADVGNFRETVIHSVDGFLYKTPEEFKNCLQLLIDIPSLRDKVGAANYQSIKNDFNTDRIAAYYVKILKKALRKGKTVDVDVADHRGAKWLSPEPQHAA